jgi:hypothetical protein
MDEKLQSLIDEVCKYPENTLERQKALHNLLVIVQNLPGILKSTHQDYSLALNQTWEWFCRNLCRFEPYTPSLEESLVKWINGYLRHRIKDIHTQGNPNEISIDQPLSNNDGEQFALDDILLPDPGSKNLDLLDIEISKLQERQRQRIGQKVRQQIQEDKQGKLKACHPRNHPECHCRLLAERLLLQEPPDKIAHIATEFNIKDQTLHSHWKRKCLPLLQDIAENSGYKP